MGHSAWESSDTVNLAQAPPLTDDSAELLPDPNFELVDSFVEYPYGVNPLVPKWWLGLNDPTGVPPTRTAIKETSTVHSGSCAVRLTRETGYVWSLSMINLDPYGAGTSGLVPVGAGRVYRFAGYAYVPGGKLGDGHIGIWATLHPNDSAYTLQPDGSWSEEGGIAKVVSLPGSGAWYRFGLVFNTSSPGYPVDDYNTSINIGIQSMISGSYDGPTEIVLDDFSLKRIW